MLCLVANCVAAFRAFVDHEISQIILSYVSVLLIAWIIPDVLLLIREYFEKVIKLPLSLVEVFTLGLNLPLSILEILRYVIARIWQFFESSSDSLLGAATNSVHVIPRSPDTVGGTRAIPADVVLSLLSNEADTLQHVSDVVNASLLDVEHFDGIIQIKGLVWSFLEQVDEFFGQFNQTIFFAAPSVVLNEIAS